MKINFNGKTKQVIDDFSRIDNSFQDIFYITYGNNLTYSKHIFPNYNHFTNVKFFQMEFLDFSFFRNCYFFFTANIFFKILIFMILNKLFYCLYRKEVSRNLRIYSFRVYFFQLLFLDDIQYVFFIGLRNLQHLFKTDRREILIDTAFLVILWFCFTVYLSLPFIYRYIYKKLSFYFLTNAYRMKGVLAFQLIRFGIKPLISSSIHALMYDSPQTQLLLLAAV